MLWLIFQGVLIAAIIGLIVKFAASFIEKNSYSYEKKEITWQEYGLALAIIAVVLSPLISFAGWHIAKSNNLSYEQNLNGWELQAVAEDIPCSRDGPCWYEYDCDPYIVWVAYDCGTTDNPQTCYRPETRYHSCPYVDTETNYIVKTTLGDFTIAEHLFPSNPQSRRWRKYKSVPDYVIAKAGIGPPIFWQKAKERLVADKPGPVTKRNSYDNYILASDATILNQYSEAIEKYKKLLLLPDLNTKVENFYYSDRVYFVGLKPLNVGEWQKRLAYLNAALGSQLQGDLHLVIVKDSKEINPDEYILALKAYWQNGEIFGDNAFAKNGIIVVVGANSNKTAAWGRAITGMPLGNETLTTAVRNNLKGIVLTPEILIGSAPSDLRGQIIAVKTGDGKLERLLWGKDNPATKFARISMTGQNPDDVGTGFMYLSGEINLSGRQKVAILIIVSLASVGIWIFAVFNETPDIRTFIHLKK